MAFVVLVVRFDLHLQVGVLFLSLSLFEGFGNNTWKGG